MPEGRALSVHGFAVVTHLGGKAADGRQYISWIHDQDFIRAVHFLIDNSSMSGPVQPLAQIARDSVVVGLAPR